MVQSLRRDHGSNLEEAMVQTSRAVSRKIWKQKGLLVRPCIRAKRARFPRANLTSIELVLAQARSPTILGAAPACNKQAETEMIGR
ncbi:hypothetical protein Tco_0588930 [Tanacetum coccineum]